MRDKLFCVKIVITVMRAPAFAYSCTNSIMHLRNSLVVYKLENRTVS